MIMAICVHIVYGMYAFKYNEEVKYFGAVKYFGPGSVSGAKIRRKENVLTIC